MRRNLISTWKILKKKINQRSHRERALLLVTGAALIWMFMFNIITPLSNKIDDSLEERNNLEQQYQGTLQALNQLQDKLHGKINPATHNEAQQLEAILEEHNKSLNKFKGKLILAQDVPYLLENVLNDFLGLSLLKVETLEPVRLKNNQDNSPLEALYRQSIKMTFVGEYDELLRYVKRIENLPYPIWWETLEYKITRFPKAQIELTVYIISEHVNWIGV